MIKLGFLFLAVFSLGACASSSKEDSYEGPFEDAAPRVHSGAVSGGAKKTMTTTAKTTITTTTTKMTPTTKPVNVDPQDLQALDKMAKSLEAYVLKDQEAGFKKLCRDPRFDCFVDDVFYPKGKKKVTRSVPPYASGSKMGLKGEKRVHARYEFYP